MGMYTELIFGARLKKDTPNEVIETLRYLVGDIEKPEKVAIDLWRNPLNFGSYYFAVNSPVRKMWFDEIDEKWHISTRANIKNYESDIEKFLEWIKPFVAGGSGTRDMYAIVIYEESDEPTIYYLYEAE
jgi:hypothetical protein